MRILKKNQETADSQDSGTLLTAKQVSQIASVIIMLLFFTFVAGYYWGKRNTISELKETFDQETVADKISYSLALNANIDSSDISNN